MQSKRPLYKVPVPSTTFTKEAYFVGEGILPAIRFDYQKDGVKHHGGIEFKGTSSLRMRAERSCKPWHIEHAYDTLIEIEDSAWVEEIRADTAEQWRNKFSMHHYMIYLDSVGCFEVIAESWCAL